MQTPNWHHYHDIFYDTSRHSVSGHLRIARELYSPQLDNKRDIIVYLPPTYHHSTRRYPVLYMHDGYNLFDEATSYTGEWHVDETMEYLAYHEQLEAIVVGIPNMGKERLNEYSPFVDPDYGGGKGGRYLAFIVDTLKPIIDRDFRTKPDKAHTGIAGSSMGGLISLFAFFQRPQTFGFTCVMSPSLWFADAAILRYAQRAPFQDGKIYLDAGTREMGGAWPDQGLLVARSRRYYGQVRLLKRILARKGYRPTVSLLHIEGKGDNHNETAWATRLPNAIRFFLGAEIVRD